MRNTRASSMLEIPATLWLLFIVLFMPMMALATMTLRSTLLSVAVQDAAHNAAKAQTFAANTADGPSASDVAASTVSRTVRAFSGLAVNSVDNDILATELVSGTVTRYSDKLPAPADTSRYLYQIETTVRGKVDPLITSSSGLFGQVPGLTAPIPLSYSAREMAENPQGLNR